MDNNQSIINVRLAIHGEDGRSESVGDIVAFLRRSMGLVGLVFLLLMAGCDSSSKQRASDNTDLETNLVDSDQDSQSDASSNSVTTQRMAFVNEVRPKVEAFCGDCHAMPRPTSSTKEMWVEEVNQGFALYGESGRNDLVVPDYNDVLKFFQFQAPAEI